MAIFDDVLNPQSQPPRLFDDVAPPKPAPDTSNIDLSAPVGKEGFAGGVQDFVRGLARGTVSTLPEQVGQAVDFFADRPTEVGQALQDFGKANEERFPSLKESIVGQRESQDVLSLRGAAGSAGENTPLSAGPGLAGAAVGAGIGAALGGVGALPGAAAGYALGSLAALPIFYGSQGKQTADKVEQAQVAAGVDPVTAHNEARIAGHESGAIEAGGELAADLIPISKLFHPFVKPVEGALVKSMFSGQFKRAATTLAEMQLGEVGTEMAQQAGESAVEGAHGAGPGATWNDTASVMLPTALMTLLPGAFTVAHNIRTVGQAQRALTDPKTNASDRAVAAGMVVQHIGQANPAVAQAFDRYARDQIATGKPIELADDNVYLAHAAAAPSGPMTQAVQTATPAAPVNSDAGPISAAAVTANASGAVEQAAATRQTTVDEAQHAADLQTAAEEAKAASKPKNENAVEPEEVAPPPVRPTNVSFPFKTVEAAMQRADLMTKQSGTQYRVIPHPTVHDAFAVAPVEQQPAAQGAPELPRVPPAEAADLVQRHAEQTALYRANREAARNERNKEAPADQEVAAQPSLLSESQENNAGAENAVQEPRAGALLQREQERVGEPGGERGRVQSGEQGNEAAAPLEPAAEEAAPTVGAGEGERNDQENAARAEEGAGAVERTPTPAVIQQAIDKVGEDRFKEYADAHIADAGELSPEEHAAEIEGVARNVVDGAYDEAPKAGAETNTAIVSPPEHPTDIAAHEAATSPTNEKPEPTAPQALAGNYEKGHLNVGPLDISIENPEGSTRSDKEHTPPQWSSLIQKAHYGYIRGTIGRDKDHIDAFVKPSTNPDHAGPVYVIDQLDAGGKFDEHKVMIGFKSKVEAIGAYKANYPKGHKVGPVTETTMADFAAWARDKTQTVRRFEARKAPASEVEQRMRAAADTDVAEVTRLADEGHSNADLIPREGPPTKESNDAAMSVYEDALRAAGWKHESGHSFTKGGHSLFLRSQGALAAPIVQWKSGNAEAAAKLEAEAKAKEQAETAAKKNALAEAKKHAQQLKQATRTVQADAFNALKTDAKLVAAAGKDIQAFEADVLDRFGDWAEKERANADELRTMALQNMRKEDVRPFAEALHKAAKKEAARITKEQAEAAKKPPTKKLENTGEDLRRHWELVKAELKAKNDAEGITGMNRVFGSTARADLFRGLLAEGATPGAQLLADKARDTTKTFKEWAAGYGGPLDNLNGRVPYSRRGGEGAIIESFVKGDAYLGSTAARQRYRGIIADEVLDADGWDPQSATAQDRLTLLGNFADEYMRHVRQITEPMRGLSGAQEVGLAVQRAIWNERFASEAGAAGYHPSRYQAMKDENLTPIGKALKDAKIIDVDFAFFQPGSYDLGSIVKRENEIQAKSRAEPLVPPRLEKIERTGLPESRKGNVTPKQFKDTFGFSDVGFGSWVHSKEDQAHLNAAYDAFSDLARFLGIDPTLIGFQGKLHFTLGALGHGSKAAATFHPAHPGPNGTVQVINLTKTKGDGTVAHEWGHALDHFLRHHPSIANGEAAMREIVAALKTKHDFEAVRAGAMRGLRGHSWMRGDKRAGPVENARNLIDYYARRGVTTDYKREADKLGEDYWGNDAELVARAWEAWVSDELGGVNNYLVNPAWVGDGMVTPPRKRGTPYPRGDERKAFGRWFKALASSLRVKEGGVTIDPQAWLANKPNDVAEFRQAVEELKADVPMLYEQMKLEDAAKAAESERQKAAALKAQQEAAAAEQREEEAEHPSEPPIPQNTALSEEDLEKLFDDAASDLKTELHENGLAAEPGEAALNNDAAISAPPKHDVPPSKGRGEQPARASTLIVEAGKLGVKGIDEALTGLTKLFGGGKIQSFPGAFDEKTYAEAKPHFESALKAFQAAGKTLKDLFKLLIQQFGEGVKPYAIRFAQDMKLSATLGDNPSASKKVAEWVRDQLGRSQKIEWPQLFAKANEAFGGTQADAKYTPKDAYDAAEAGMNLWLQGRDLRSGPVDYAKGVIEHLKSVTNLLPTQTKRTAEMDEFQQFSTVPALAFVANWVAKIAPGETMLEPSAGVGGIAAIAKTMGASVVVNELSSRRAAVLREVLPDARVFVENAEQLNNTLPDDVQPTVIVMNPPFSSTAGRIEGSRNNMNGARHIEQALERLQAGGRLVAIVGRGMGETYPGMFDWWRKIKGAYTVRANVGINGAEYAKYGTTFDNQILVIDKVGPTTGDIVTGRAEAYAELPALLSNVRELRHEPNASDRTPEQPAAESGGGETVAPELGQSGESQPPLTGGVGIGGGDQRGNTGRRPDAGSGGGAGVPPATGGSAEGNEPPRRGGRTTGSGRAGRAEPDTGSDAGAGNHQGLVSGELTLDASGAARRDRELTDAIFEDYVPEKAKVKGSQPHPGKLVESAAMASVEPIDATYTPNLPRESIESGALSAAQLEPIIYAGQAHQEILPNGQRRGYFIGDGTGVGKGREISGILLDNQRQGRPKHVWISAKTGLFKDAKRDLGGAGGDPKHLFKLGDYKPVDKVKHKDGVAFLSYSLLRSGEKKNPNEKDKKVRSRVDQLVEWLGDDFDGVIAFDEAHKMGNAGGQKGSRGMKEAAQAALAGLDLQKRLPKARVVYVSATGATEVANLMYATRLGMWGANTSFATPEAFSNSITAAGIASMELVARDLKAQGSYIARSLSYDGVEYDKLAAPLSELQTEIYNELAKAWQIVLKNVHAALESTNQHRNGNAKGAALSKFWGTHQRFFNQVITSMQTPAIIDRAQSELAAGNAVVFQLVNTNEATQERLVKNAEAEGEPLEELDFSPRETLIEYIRRGFPVAEYQLEKDADGRIKSVPVLDSKGEPVMSKAAIKQRDALIETLKAIRVPDNPIDLIIEALGEKNVAEVTGRGRRFIRSTTPEGEFSVVEQKRGASANDADAKAFMDDRKRALIFSDAGGTGYSFQSDLNEKNQRRRIHFLVQPGWRADNAVQGFGRTHRSNEANQPLYVLPQTNLKAQKRFISSIARRLDQLGALTKGQRQTGSQGLFTNRDNLESKYAQAALRNLFEEMAPSHSVKGRIENATEMLEAMGLSEIYDPKTGGITEGKMPTVPQFLNRLLSLTMDQQDVMFSEFEQRMDAAIDAAMENGTFDDGMQTVKALKVHKLRDEAVYEDQRTKAKTRYVELELTNATTLNKWDDLANILAQYPGKGVEYHLDNVTGMPFALVDLGTRIGGDGQVQHRGYRINVTSPSMASRGVYITNVDSIRKGGDWRTIARDEATGKVRTAEPTERTNVARSFRYEKVPMDVAEYLWNDAYDAAPKTATSKMHMLTGVLLPVWDRVQLADGRAAAVVRTQTDEGERFIGRLLPEDDRARILKNFGIGAVAQNASAAELLARVQAGETAQLSNGWLLKPVRVSNEQRIEIKATYISPSEIALLKRQGAFTERIAFQERVFVPPTAEAFEAVTRGANRPVVDFLGAPKLSVAEFPPRASMIRVTEPSSGVGQDVQELRDSFSQHYGINFPEGSLVYADVPGGAASATRDVAAIFGKRVEFIRNLRPDLVNFNGVTLGGNTFYLNADATRPHLMVAGHELLHHLREEQPDVYNALRAAVRPLLNDDAMQQYARRRLGPNAARHTSDSIEEELIADVVGENFGNPVFWSKMARANPSRFQQIAQAVLNFLRDLIGRFNGKGFMARNYLRDFTRAQDAVVKAMAMYAGRTQSKFGDALALDRDAPLFSMAEPMDLTARATQWANDTLLRSPKQFSFLRPFQTQYHKAQVNRYFRPVFESAQAYLRDVSRFATDSSDKALDLLPRLGSLRDVLPAFMGGTKAAERADVAAAGKAMFAATLAKARPTDKQLLNGATFQTDEGAIDIPALTDAQMKLYHEARAAIDLGLEQVAVSEAYKLAQGENIGAVLLQAKNDAEHGIEMIVTALRAQADQLDELGQKTEAIHKRKVAADVADLGLKTDQLRQEGYAPLMRFGRYTVDVQRMVNGQPERVYFSMFETKREMYEREREMRELYPGAMVTAGTMDEAQWQLYQGLSLDSLAAFASATGADRDPLFQDFYKLALSSRSALKRLIHRKGIAGYNEDLQRVLASFITSQARLAAKNFHFAEMTRAATAIPVQYGDVRTEAANLVKYVQNPTEEASKLRGLLFVNFLGGSVASALTNMTQPFMMTAPFLSRYTNPAAAFKALGQAMHTSSVPADPQLRAALDRAAHEGITDPQELHQLYAESIRGIGRNLQVRKGLRAWGSFFALAERFNRRITFIAAFKMAQEVGMDAINESQAHQGLPTFLTPYGFAAHVVEDTQGIYNRGNRPNAARGALGATVFTFKQFTIAYLEFLSRLPAREKAFAAALLFLASGLQGAPGADDLEDLLDTLGQLMGFNTNSKQALREGAVKILGDTLGGFVTHGISGVPGMPFDIQARLGLGNLIPGTALFKRSETDKTSDIAEFAGPAGSLYTQVMGGYNAAVAGRGLGAIAMFAAPTAIRNALQGVDMWTSGQYVDQKGRKVISTTPLDALFKGVGLQPQDVAKASQKAVDVRQNIAMTTTVEAAIADKWARAILDHDNDGVRAAVAELHAWNLRNPSSPIMITPAQIRQRVQAAMMERSLRIAKSAPKEIRGEAMRGLQ